MLLYIISIILISILLFITIFLFVKNKKLVSNIKAMTPLINTQTSFDPLIGTGKGMDEINNFLRTNYLKFINSKLITINEETEAPVSELLTRLASNEEMAKLTIGFVGYVSTMMSKELKSFFNKYYNVLDEDKKVNDIFVQYVSDWFMLAIRELQAELSVQKGISKDYSIQGNLQMNSNIFINIETELYKSLKITEEVVEQQPQKK
jgi:hypothetical protein